jgi:hypothetical protein
MAEIVKKYIEQKEENDLVDFKRKFYSKDNKADMLKDILSFVNNTNDIDKYIIFGYSNTDDTYLNIDYNDIEDISCYIQLINEYCDPFIDIKIEKFVYNTYNMAYLMIKKSNTNRPYFVKKEYKKGNTSFLRKGEIYIRKNANNFICSRDDLDSIYESRNKFIIYSTSTDLYKIKIKEDINVKELFGVKINIVNNTHTNYMTNKTEINIFLDSNVSINCLYIEDYATEFRKELTNIEKHPFSIKKESQLCKIIIFQISNSLLNIILNRIKKDGYIKVNMKFFDFEKHEFDCNFNINGIE